MVWITALALAALSTQVSHKNEVACDLAPFVGGGSSSEGKLDSLNGLGLGCSVVLFDGGRWTVGPRVDFTEQRWTVLEHEGETTFFKSYQARTLGLGLNTTFAFNDDWQLAYGLNFAMGQGQQDQNVSTAHSTSNLHLSGMAQRDLRHELTVSRRFNQRLSFLAGVQYATGHQSWELGKGSLEREDVAEHNALTLTSGSGRDLTDAGPQEANYKAWSLKIGVQMLLYSSL